MGYGYEQKWKVSRESFGLKYSEKQVRCLEKPYGITELQDFEWLEDAIFYTEVFNPEVVPKMFFSTENGSGSTRNLKFYVLTFADYKLFQINKFSTSQSLIKL